MKWFGEVPWKAASGPDKHRQFIYAGVGVWAQADFPLTSENDLDQQMFYGRLWKNPGDMIGFSTAFNTLDRTKAQCALNVIDAGDTDNLGSIWLIGWGDRTVWMASPDGEFGLPAGLVIADWRYVVRIANINSIHTEADIFALMAEALLRLPTTQRSQMAFKPVFYVGKEIVKRMRDQRSQMAWDTGLDLDAIEFCGVPIREIAALRCDEARVT